CLRAFGAIVITLTLLSRLGAPRCCRKITSAVWQTRSCARPHRMLKVSFCQTPYHLLEALAFYNPASEMIIVIPHADRYRALLADLSGIEFVEVESRRNVLSRLVDRGEPFDYYFATLWNRTALLFEKAALRLGGSVHIFDDGAGGFGEPGNDWRKY